MHERRNALLFLVGLLGPVAVLRAALWISPNSDFNVAGHNIHHLFSGLVLVTLAGIPLSLFQLEGRWRDVVVVTFAVGLGLALDEWVYLIATDGSNASYLLPVSLWGAVAVLALAVIYTVVLLVVVRNRSS